MAESRQDEDTIESLRGRGEVSAVHGGVMSDDEQGLVVNTEG